MRVNILLHDVAFRFKFPKFACISATLIIVRPYTKQLNAICLLHRPRIFVMKRYLSAHLSFYGYMIAERFLAVKIGPYRGISHQLSKGVVLRPQQIVVFLISPGSVSTSNCEIMFHATPEQPYEDQTEISVVSVEKFEPLSK